ncbi:glycosyltransferase [Oribacterium sp. FC2011]|uniref:glycosyltransferase n=1 Tax=Oribacterium sp. FC2011 TaxID=1408311 RepID=UPI0004E15525|nr:glycosyltransferase [Oribacterium sp. FC2011]
MNIVFVFDGLQVGGIERVGIDYIKLLIDRGHKVSVVNVTPALKDLYHQLPKTCEIHEISLTRSMVPYRYAKGIEKGIKGAIAYAGISTALTILNALKRTIIEPKLKSLANTDVVIAFSGHFNDLMFVASGYLPGKKIAWLHGSEFEYKVISDGYFALYRKIKNLVCLSELCDITCKKFNDENGIRKELIYNPILIKDKEIDEEKVANLKSKYGRFALMAGRLAPDKDQKTAILAIKHLNEQTDRTIHLLLAGDGVNRKELEEFTKNQNASEYIHFLGNCLDMQNYYSAAYAYVHSSPMEGLPTVLLEAMAYGVPIAATDSIPGVREILGNNVFGLISPVGDQRTLGDNIGKIYDDSLLREMLKERGYERIKDFAPNKAVNKLEHLINEI